MVTRPKPRYLARCKLCQVFTSPNSLSMVLLIPYGLLDAPRPARKDFRFQVHALPGLSFLKADLFSGTKSTVALRKVVKAASLPVGGLDRHLLRLPVSLPPMPYPQDVKDTLLPV